MRQRIRDGRGTKALVLALLAVPPMTATAAEYEQPPVLRAADVLPADLRKGPHHTVADKVANDGFVNTYQLRTAYGDESVRTTLMLRLRANEAEAIAKIRALAESDEFKEGLGEGVGDVAAGFKRLAEDPGGAVKGAASGVRKMFEIAGEAWHSRNTYKTGIGDLTRNVSGYSKVRRELAAKLGVDPYSSNTVLQADLDRVAAAAFQGGFAVTLAKMLVPGGLGLVVGAASWTESLNALLITSSPTELRLINREKLLAMNVNADIAELFIDNPAFTPTSQTFLVGALEQMKGAEGRQAFVKYAIPTDEEELALFRMRMAQMYANYHKAVRPIVRFVSAGKMVAGVTADEKLLIVAPVDHLAWTQTLEGFVALFAETIAQGDAPAARELWLSGTVSTRARSEMDKRGWSVRENAAL